MISRTSIHAIRALAQLARLGLDGYVGAGTLAREIGAPQNYLGKLLQTLTRAGLVESRKGAGGGFRLARAADRITLLEALDPIEQFDRWRICMLGAARCSDEFPCALHHEWAKVRDRYLALLSKTTIEDVIRQAPLPGLTQDPAKPGDSLAVPGR